ncbi:beta-1,3-galactosyltransferase 6 [Prorops nasuta]|uniref:beta-1,3-galactosyltransferase 6 n=1 Tax=Prorops nasuta TaxID=863751 RepID=UPI0034CF1C76
MLMQSTQYLAMFNKRYILIKPVTTVVIVLFTILCVYYMWFLNCYCYDKQEVVREKTKFRLIVIILSNPNNLEQRNAVRNTWLLEKDVSVKNFFVIGTKEIESDEMDTIESENKKFSDLIILSRLQDSYNTLTKKLLYALKLIFDEYKFDFVLKCDDDTFVVMPKLLKELNKWQNKGTKKELYWGFFNGKAVVKKNGPWKETDWFLCDYYLPYALGGGYVLSYNLVAFIGTNMDLLKLHTSEDVSVGLWLAPLGNIERKHDVRFDTEYRSRGCSNQYIITHKQSIANMKSMYEHYKTSGSLCVKEFKTRMSYRYNWSVLPSQCCNRQSDII